VDELLAEGRVARVEPSDKRHTDFLLFAMPPGRPAIEELSSEICAARTSSPSARSVQVAELKAAKERADAEKGKKDRTGSIRNWKNTPLGTPDELSEMFRR